MGGLPLNYLRKITVSRKLARPLRPGRMRTSESLTQALRLRNGAETREAARRSAAILGQMNGLPEVLIETYWAVAHA